MPRCCESSSVPWAKPTPPLSVARLGTAALIAVNMMAVTLALNLSAPEGIERGILEPALVGATALVALLVGGPLIRNVIRAARARRISFDFLFLAGIVGSLGLSVRALADGGGGALYFEVTALLFVIHGLGETIGSISRARALARLAIGTADAPQTVRVVRDASGHAVESRSLSDVRRGDVVRVHPGELIHVDGIVVRGKALLDRSSLTGEAKLSPAGPGAHVFAGFGIYDATLDVRCEVGLGGRVQDGIRRAVERALQRPSESQRVADQFVGRFFPLVLLIAVASFLISTSLGASPAEGVQRALAVLLVACPCAMGFATPLAVWLGVGELAKKGLLARASEALEELARVDTVLFDKTGTLTDGQARLLAFEAAPGFERHEVLAWVQAIQQTQAHPLARAFRPGASPAASSVSDAIKVRSTKILPGLGIEAELDCAPASPGVASAHPTRIRIGHPELLGGSTLASSMAERLGVDPRARGLIVLRDGKLAGMAIVDEAPSPHVKTMLNELRALGVKAQLLTGDDPERAEGLGFDLVRGRLRPQDKLAIVRDLRATGARVAFVGDGLNDAAALAESDVGIAVDGGVDLARQASTWTWLGSDPRVIPYSLGWARKVRAVIKANFYYAAAYNCLGMAAAALGLLHPVWAALLMVASSLFVTWRTAIRLSPTSEGEPLRSGPTPNEIWPLPGHAEGPRKVSSGGVAFLNEASPPPSK